MSNNDKTRNQSSARRDFSDEKPYNDFPCLEGQVLAPLVVKDDEMVRTFNMNQDNFKTWSFGGKRVRVAFMPVYEDQLEDMMKVFHQDVNEYLSGPKQEKLDKVSLDAMFESMTSEDASSYDPTGVPSHEEALMLMEALDELIDEVYRRNPKYGKILKLIYANIDITKQEIITELGLKKSQGYKVIHEAQEMAKIVHRELNQ